MRKSKNLIAKIQGWDWKDYQRLGQVWAKLKCFRSSGDKLRNDFNLT
jgi:hypothetical protein